MLFTFKFPHLRRRDNVAPAVPQEILELILAFCTPKDLRSCSLTSTDLRFPAQKMLFRKITIHLYPSAPARYGHLDDFLTSNPRIASYIRHLTLGLSWSSWPPQVLPHLKGLRALTLDVHSYKKDDWRAFPTPLRDALETLMKAPDMQTLELQALAHFSLAVALPLTHLVIIGRRPLAITPHQIPAEGPSRLHTLRVEHNEVLQTIVDAPFLDLSRLVRFDAFVGDRGAPVTIQHVLNICAPTLQELCLRAHPSDSFDDTLDLSLALLSALTDLTLPLTTTSSLQWCTHTLLTLLTPVTVTVTFHTSGPLPHNQPSWGHIDCMPLWAQIDDLPLCKLHFRREPPWEVGSEPDEPSAKELLPKLARRKVLVGPSPPPPLPRPPTMEVQSRSLWSWMLSWQLP
ncbi:hypothetical protein DXG01_016853 [Tephrocybe rancida]|nr:hypothetical protein DXG01_016853 [Tephrocybe rancida]